VRSVADDLRRELRERGLRLTPAERVALALRLGDEDANRLATARGMSIEEARLLIRRSRQAGRTPSRAAECP
jgi:hypothetical protein